MICMFIERLIFGAYESKFSLPDNALQWARFLQTKYEVFPVC